jgi:hypothetical protein
MVFGKRSVTQCFQFYNLHWLPIHLRINFKLALLTYKTITLHQPSYLFNLLSLQSTARSLRYSDQKLLHQPRVRTVTGSRTFSSSAIKYGILYFHLYAPRPPSTLSSISLKLRFHLFPCRPLSSRTGSCPRL